MGGDHLMITDHHLVSRFTVLLKIDVHLWMISTHYQATNYFLPATNFCIVARLLRLLEQAVLIAGRFEGFDGRERDHVWVLLWRWQEQQPLLFTKKNARLAWRHQEKLLLTPCGVAVLLLLLLDNTASLRYRRQIDLIRHVVLIREYLFCSRLMKVIIGWWDDGEWARDATLLDL